MDENCEPIEQKGEMVLRCRVRPQKSRPKGDFFVVLHGISLIIHENVAKIFTFFPFFLTFGGWDWNHFVQNFMENKKKWKAKPIKQRKVLKIASKDAHPCYA